MHDIKENHKRHMDILEKCEHDATILSRSGSVGSGYMTPAHRAVMVNLLDLVDKQNRKIAELERRIARMDGMGGRAYEGAAQ